MGRHPVGPTAAGLPWLAPAARSLVALADDPPPFSQVIADPAVVLLAVRYARPSPTPSECLSPTVLEQPILLTAAAAHLDAHPCGWADPALGPTGELLRAAASVAAHGRHLAAASGRYPPAAAYVGGLLAPLGWLAVAAVDPDAVDAVRGDERFRDDPQRVQETAWGLSADGIARRLAARWRLPGWLALAVGTLSHTVTDAVALGADAGLTAVLRAAVVLAERDGHRLGLLGRSSPDDVADLVALGGATAPEPVSAGDDPYRVPLLPALLRAAARGRRQSPSSDPHVELDRLHRLVADTRAGFDRAVRDAKLNGLAELAAGAGHEINNPLAIISGNAQLLRSAEDDLDRQQRIEVIIRQTRRLADLLHDLRQFARPPVPGPESVRPAEIVAGVVDEHAEIAEDAGVLLETVAADDAAVLADRGQLGRVIAHLVRNAIEAAARGGAVRVGTRRTGDAVRVCVEDTGPGPVDAAVPHLFDPFFSGRSAGRGRGLGLATAWRLASQNGGDLAYSRPPGGPTRFTLTLPAVAAPPASLPERRSA